MRRNEYRVDWVVPGLLAACAYPTSDASLALIAKEGIEQLINLDLKPVPGQGLSSHALVEVHVPVPDGTSPTPGQLSYCIQIIDEAKSDGRAVAVHCWAGLGRTGTVIACYMVAAGASPDDAVKRVRAIRPGSIETVDQMDAIYRFAEMWTASHPQSRIEQSADRT